MPKTFCTLAGKAKFPMASTTPHASGKAPMYPPSAPANPQVPKQKEIVPQESASTFQSLPQNPSHDTGPSSSEAVYWEPYPYLTCRLLSWLLERPADRAVLFYDKASGKPALPQMPEPLGDTRRTIYPVIAKVSI
ncbi:hypothetical protein BU15DRAFT_79261 [Melanogaster broomeanus]|nr:hypothetical protein BU15DRAFT_79261 [Melanogaster broomeanus]